MQLRAAPRGQAASSTSERAGSGRFSRLNLRLRAGKPRSSRPAARMAWRSATEMGWRVRGSCLWCVPSSHQAGGTPPAVQQPRQSPRMSYVGRVRVDASPARPRTDQQRQGQQGFAKRDCQPGAVYAGPSDEREGRHGRDGQGDGNPAQNVRHWGTISPPIWRCRVDAHARVLSRLLLRGSASTSLPASRRSL